uniref:Lysozyme n=1 Tax=Otus sunia TaxID=257818 RepID=A0A8C8AYT6_9STRI
MESPLRLLLLALLTAATKAKVFSQCNLSHVLQKEWLDGYGGYRLANCEFHTFNVAAQSIKANDSANYGVFQISSQLWCTEDHRPLDNGCLGGWAWTFSSCSDQILFFQIGRKLSNSFFS